uniref:Pectate lyase superfamily protein domain-containing protein n=1 Tax=Haliea sp. ETY-M TaxID=1055105 RepID=A0A455R351_9GAMM|nr:hypothetical protein [Haliea sp. ETY-M]
MRRLFVSIVALLITVTSPAALSDAVFSVPPSGLDDTSTIQAAFDAAVNAGPGSTVKLEAGSYCLTSPLIVRGFSGTWIGAGKEQTTLKTCPDVFPVPQNIVPDPAYPADPPFRVLSPIVFIEVAGKPSQDIQIREITIELAGETNPWTRPGLPGDLTIFRPAIQILGRRPTVLDGAISSVSLAVDRIGMIGNAEGSVFGTPYETNIDNGIEILGSLAPGVGVEPVTANVSITRSHFERVAFSAIQTVYCLDCNVTFGGSSKNGNTSSLNFGGAVFASIVGGSSFLVSHNVGATQNGAFFQAVPHAAAPNPGPAQIVVAHNEFDLFPAPINPSYGITLVDIPSAFFGTPVISATIENNTFRQTDIGFGEGSLFGVDNFVASDTVIRNNRFSGHYAVSAIAAGYFDGPPPGIADNLLLKGNNLTGASAGVAPVWLGPYSTNSVVVGGPNSRHVFDQGYGNIATGVNNARGNPPGPRLQDLLGAGSMGQEPSSEYQGFGITSGR